MIRNVAVKKATPKDAGFSASNTKVLRTSAGESLLNDQNNNINNAQRLNRPANDNTVQRLPANPRQRLKRASNDHKLKPASMSQVKEVTSKAVAVANAGSAAWFIVGVTWIFYMVQFVFALVSLMGFATISAVAESWVGYVDFFGVFSDNAQDMTSAGIGMTAAMGIFTLIVAIVIFLFRGVDIARGNSVLIMAVCFALNTAPVASLVPWIWVWCLYVVKSQINK
ncbi:hypothetical protein H6788_01550 [Candidatus Nomurabacteria bacterium]|nr:hypothetical protein [Candidatus Nomurabacteria bacterium]MCB9819617.1 hypothetical protein [Candidatus Nomurabacteria bacterium]